jgi:N4-gp56 family major capsid protein
MANITVTTAANMIPEVWSSDVLYYREAKLVLAKLVRRFDADAKFGDIIHIPNVAEITARSKSASTAITYDANTEAVTDITINKHKYVGVLIEDIAQIQSKPDLIKIYTQTSGYSLAKAVDTDIAALATGFSQTVGTAGTALTDANLLTAIQYLDDANAPEDDRHLVVKPSVKKNILTLDKFVLFQNVGSSAPVRSGQIGELYGVEIHVTSNISVTDVTVDVTNNMLFHRDAIGLAMQKDISTETQRNIDHLATAVVSSCLYGVAEIRDSFGVWIKT